MNDLISRQDAINAVYERIRQIGYENNPLVLSIRQAIRELPSIDAVKHGRWKCISFLTVECSECKTQIHDLECSDFCPNCGARMDAERKES